VSTEKIVLLEINIVKKHITTFEQNSVNKSITERTVVQDRDTRCLFITTANS